MLQVYGLTEELSILTDGRPTAGAEVRIADNGTLHARGISQMLSYFRDKRATELRCPDGWLRTGDLAEIGPDGLVRVIGRSDDMIISGGFNIQPGEVEEVLRGHPDIADAAVFGTPDRDMGQVVGAWIITQGNHIDTDEVRAFCRMQLAHYKMPKTIREVLEFPLTANGKRQTAKCNVI